MSFSLNQEKYKYQYILCKLKHYVEEQINQKNTPNDNYLVAITKSYPSQILNENEFFGMEKKE